jgi:hypothetical protein
VAKTVPAGATIDCTGRAVTVTGQGKIRVEDGTFTLRAASLVVATGPIGMIEAGAVKGGRDRGMRLEIAGSVTIDGMLKAESSEGGGTIVVVAGGNIDVRNYGITGIEASGTGSGADGGRIQLESGGSITIYNPVRANGGGQGECNGGQISLDAAGDITIGGSAAKVSVEGRQSDAGEIELESGNDLTIQTGSSISANGQLADGDGGAIRLTAGNRVVISAPHTARGGVMASGNDSTGGSVSIDSGCGGVQLNASLDLRAGDLGAGYDAGSLDVSSLGDLTIGRNVDIDTHASGGGGNGGTVALESAGKLVAKNGAVIDTRGDTSRKSSHGTAGSVSISGCDVDIGPSVQIKASGSKGGAISVESATPLLGVTTLHIASTSLFDASGSRTALNGRVRVAVVHGNSSGTCSNKPARKCARDADCTVAGTPGQCQGLNPDTDDRRTQFVTAANITEDLNLAACESICNR